GDEYLEFYYGRYFEQPFRKAALKALSGEPMVQIDPPESVPLDDERWQIEAVESEIVEHLGQQALKIKGGAAMLPDINIRNGLVEFDIAVTPDRGFAGLIFRSQDNANFEHFYIRPHQSGNPDANQYTPVFNGASAWQLYHGEGYGAAVEYRYNQWMHVRVIFAGSKAKVYIDSNEPVLHIDDLKRDDTGGGLGLQSANFSSVHFANFKFTPLADAYEFPARNAEAAPAVPGLVTSWQVSEVFDGNSLRGTAKLDAGLKENRTWTELQAEPAGIANLARINGLGENKNTVFARISVTSKHAGVKELVFGYSDTAAVFVNDVLVYRGNNTYMTRDYRYLGTIGLFDSVALPLKAGENEIWIAVSEAFGGWGIMASISELD
ncbi:MAG: family 16 glycoside hydrolase, partial [Pirellulaceae bacterium]